MDRISFVVAVYNVENYIRQCIESLLSLQSSDIEILLIDDSSTDGSYEICCSYQCIDSRVKVIRQEHEGANAARNTGLINASGKWVSFVDGDDWISPELVQALESEMNQNWDIIIFSYNKIRGSKKYPINSREEYRVLGAEDFREMQLAALNRFRDSELNYKTLDAVSIWNKLYRREFLIANGLKFVPEMPKLQDLTFNLNVYEYAASAVYMHRHLYNYRINSASVSHRYQADIITKFELINRYIENFVGHKKDEKFLEAFYERIVTHLRTIVVLYLCNSQNSNKYRNRRKVFLGLLDSAPYKAALAEAKINGLPFQERVLSFAIKNRFFAACSFLCSGLEMLNRIKEKT